ncbi:MAG: glucose-6-phosphate dehydrogenase [Candidatus Babeliales bacterium]
MQGNNQQCFDECTFVIMGATGDLAKRKLIPAICKLMTDNKLCKFALVGVSFDTTNVQAMLAQARPFIPECNQDAWNKLAASSYYLAMDFNDAASYQKLNALLLDIESARGLFGNRLFYLATMPTHFATITKHLAQEGIVENKTKNHLHKGWSKVVYEKPFGHNLTSAKQINACIKKVFNDNQVFRIDHYLGKELIGNIATMRFTNRIFEPLWNNKHIDSVQIIINETIGIEGRGAFYDTCGALKDVVQNHMLQIIALVAMEAPEQLTAQAIRQAKENVLKKVKVASAVLGQYKGYREEPNVKEDSTTETFAAVKLAINNRRWKGVPFYLKTGKKLASSNVSIHIQFKKVRCLLEACPSSPNHLVISLAPRPGFFLEFNMKEYGTTNTVKQVKMELGHSALTGPNTPEAYEILLADVINNDQVTFVGFNEIALSWKIIREITKLKPALYTYQQGTEGPEELSTLEGNKEIEWRA